MVNDTIYALATAPGKAGVAIVRLSGPEAVGIARAIAGPIPVHGRSVRTLRSVTGEVIDAALILTFAEKRSYTGESVVEFHLHGGTAIVSVMLKVIGDTGLARMAQAGEFTRRAFDSGRLDLSQVEGLADLIDAETEAQHRQAMRVFSGAIGRMAEVWRADLIRAAALIEATIDFADEDVPVDVRPEVATLIAGVQASMREQIAGSRGAERVRNGFEVAIVGRPNVGKSTLLNRLAGRDAAITSEVAGTTRDVIEVRMDLGGYAVTLLDTAGLRDGETAVEQIGIDRGRERADRADIRVHLAESGQETDVLVRDGDIIAIAKADTGNLGEFGVSGLTGWGIDELTDRIVAEVRQRAAGNALVIRERHRLEIDMALRHLGHVTAGLPFAVEMADILAEDLRTSIRAVESLVGRVDADTVLGEVFSNFCIGK